MTRRGCARQCKDLTDRFPDIAAAAVRQVEEGVVLDGELVMLVDGRLSFDALQRRLVTAPAKARRLVGAVPASYVAFGLLAVAGVDLRTQRWTVRRGRLEQLAGSFSPPLQLTPVTADLEEAREWFEVLPAAMGVEGLVVKGAATRYVGGRREWLKVNSGGVGCVRLSEWIHLRWSRPPSCGWWCERQVSRTTPGSKRQAQTVGYPSRG